MKFQYIGSGDAPPEETTVFGYEFALNGPAVEVPEPFATKLRNNRTFRVAGDAPKPAGRPHGAPDDMAAEVDPAAVLEAAGVKIDGRWGPARLRAELEKLNGAHG